MKAPAQPIAVIIPALNEEASLPKVLRDLPREHVSLVVVVDNGSTDRTAGVAAALGAACVAEPRRGYGSAMLRGLAEMNRRRPDAEVVVFLDADCSDHADELPDVVGPILAGEADLVIGSRPLGKRESGALPVQCRLGNWLACTLMRWLSGVSYTDLGPFRAIRREALAGLDMSDRGFGWTVEMQIKAAQAGLRIVEVPVSYRRRIGKSKISGTISGCVRAGAKILWTIARYGVLEPYRPRTKPARREAA